MSVEKNLLREMLIYVNKQYTEELAEQIYGKGSKFFFLIWQITFRRIF